MRHDHLPAARDAIEGGHSDSYMHDSSNLYAFTTEVVNPWYRRTNERETRGASSRLSTMGKHDKKPDETRWRHMTLAPNRGYNCGFQHHWTSRLFHGVMYIRPIMTIKTTYLLVVLLRTVLHSLSCLVRGTRRLVQRYGVGWWRGVAKHPQFSYRKGRIGDRIAMSSSSGYTNSEEKRSPSSG